MAEFFSPTPEPEHDPNVPRDLPPETKLTRTVATTLMLIWAYWWWNGYADGAYWIIAAVVIFATGETMPQYYRLLAPLWWPLSIVVRPIVFVLVTIARMVIPEAYRRRGKVLKPLSFKEINEALDEAAAERDRKNRE